MIEEGTLYIPSTLTSYFIMKLKELPPAGTFTCLGETRADIIASKIWNDPSLDWLIMSYNNVLSPVDGSFNAGKTLVFPSLNSVEKLYATLTSKQRAMEKEEGN